MLGEALRGYPVHAAMAHARGAGGQTGLPLRATEDSSDSIERWNAGVLVVVVVEPAREHWCPVAQCTEATADWCLVAHSAEATADRENWRLVALPGREHRRLGRASVGNSGGTSSPPRRRKADVPTVHVLFARRCVDRHIWIVHGAHRPSSSRRLVGGAASAAGQRVGLGVRLLRLV